MTIAVFSSSENIHSFFSKMESSREHNIYFLKWDSYENQVKTMPVGTLFYLDLRGFKKNKLNGLIKSFSLLQGKSYGLIDPEEHIDDISSIFHNGAVDYINCKLFKVGFSPIRLKRIARFIATRMIDADPVLEIVEEKTTYSGNNWSKVKTGHKYLFAMLFAEVDDHQLWKIKLGSEKYEQFMRSFYNKLNNVFEPLLGRFWMWSDTGGIILFPFDGQVCPIILTSFRLFLNRHLISVENPDFDIGMTYHFVIHIGDTVYEDRGFTSDLISDSINSIFHIGNKFSQNDSLYITEEAEKYIPNQLNDLFEDTGTFEGRSVKRMKKVHI